MTQHKDFKRLVRARMEKTGEAYTAARAQLLKQPRTASTGGPVAVAAALKAPLGPKPAEYAAIAGMADAKLKAKTGCTWERWVKALDRDRAYELPHREIATLVRTKYKTQSWWTQTVAVGYERIKGLRARGQQRDGSFQATKSRTFNVPVATLFDAWATPDVRRRWLTGAGVKVRTATPSKSMRIDFGDRGIVAVGFFAKGKSKSSVAVEHTKLASREVVAEIKQFWTERFDALATELLTGARARARA